MKHDTTENENENLIEMAGQVEAESLSAADIPEKFRNPETGEIRIEALIASYKELERKLSSMMPRPDTDEDRMSIMRMMGLPETSDEYDVDVSHGLFDIDSDMNKSLHEKGFTADQVQAVYDLAAEKLVPVILEITQEFQAEREMERLSAAFGGPEKFREMSRQLLAFGKKNLPPEVLENLSGSFEGVMALHRMMKGEEPSLSPSAQTVEPNDEKALHAMMRDPRYYRDKDPSFVAKVTDGFQRMYSSS